MRRAFGPLVAIAIAVGATGCLPGYAGLTSKSGGSDGGVVVTDAGVVITPGTKYHPDGYAAANVHGLETTLQKQDCRTCHGSDLAGGVSQVSCDSCHTQNWRTTCTFCHGGTENQTGAPPRSIDGTNSAAMSAFPPHNRHVTSTLSNALDCGQCHVKATDALSPNHMFNSSPGVAITDFGGGLSKQSTWTRASGTCANNYCHGDGRGDNGTIAMSKVGPLGCTDCHAGVASGSAGWAKMSGDHANHLASATTIGCGDCHAGTTSDGKTIASAALHVDGLREVQFAAANSGMTFDAAAQTCTGTCHNFAHTSAAWVSAVGGRYHPVGYAAAAQHGPDMELQRNDCRGCHGATLAGGTKGAYDAAPPSCDSCHTGGAAWRTNGTGDCHGSATDAAPPKDIGAGAASQGQAFLAHQAHVTAGKIRGASACTECHVMPTDVLSTNHIFDATPGRAEVVMTGGFDKGAVYDPVKQQCTNSYCHGNGQAANGTIADGAAALGCQSCHPSAGLSRGRHPSHHGATCDTCHSDVSTGGDTAIKTLALHINGNKDVNMQTTYGMTWNAAALTCSGGCHGTQHW
jgi:predicted CxxxxCH...CXXCH cytochrome family protein